LILTASLHNKLNNYQSESRMFWEIRTETTLSNLRYQNVDSTPMMRCKQHEHKRVVAEVNQRRKIFHFLLTQNTPHLMYWLSMITHCITVMEVFRVQLNIHRPKYKLWRL
jgi:hypothetical protein